MGYSGGRITAPVGIEDVRKVLGSASTDVGTLCKNRNIKKWAKYRPVDYDRPGVADTINSTTKIWNGAKEGTGHEWRFGGCGTQGKWAFTVPSFEKYTDMKDASTNEQAAAMQWTANGPTGAPSSFFRLTDFVGYNHNARKPWYASMSSKMEINGGGFSARIGTNYTPEETETGEIDPGDLAEYCQGSAKVYAGIILYNASTKLYWRMVKSVAWKAGDADDADVTAAQHFGFTIGTPSGSTSTDYYLQYEGENVLKIARNAVVEVYLFLCLTAGADPMEGTYTLFSPLFSASDTVYKRFTVEAVIRTITIDYTCANLKAVFSANTSYYYVNNDNIYKLRGVITDITGTLSTKAGSSDSGYSLFRVTLYSTTTGTRSNSTTFTVEEVSKTLYTSSNGSFEVAKTIDFAANDMPGFIGYKTQSDAENGTNGVAVSGIPIPASIVYNATDAENVGTLNRSGKLTVMVAATSKYAYTDLKLEPTQGKEYVITY